MAASGQLLVRQDLEHAIEELRREGAAHVFVRGGRVIARGDGHGVLALIRTIRRAGPGRLQGAALADKVVGRAALMAALACNVSAVHGEFMSEAAIAEGERRGLTFSYGVAIPRVLNRQGDQLCPFEAMVAGVEDPAEALRRLEDALAAAAGSPGQERRPVKARHHTVRAAQAGLWLALAILLPLLLHPLGIGPVFLPMHLPVLVGAGVSGALVAAVVGAVAPLLSHLLTGMPPLVPPIAPLMAVELAAYGLAGGWLRRRLAPRGLAGEYGWLVATMVSGRVALGLAAVLLGPALGLQIPAWVYLQGAIASGLPGMVVQLIVVPPVVRQVATVVSARRAV